MADFNYYLNRVGVRGPKGEQGEQGFSPIITVATNTLSEYILQIQTQNNTFLTANLREHKDDLGGTYIRYNRDTGVMYAGEADTATTQNLGEVRFATATELERNDGSTVVTPADVNTLINAKGYDAAIEAVDDKADTNADNIATNAGNISTLQGQMTEVLGNYVTTNTNQNIEGIKTFSHITTQGLYANYATLANGLSVDLGNVGTYQVLYIDTDPMTHDINYLGFGTQGAKLRMLTKGNDVEIKRTAGTFINVDSGNISNYVGNGTITFTQGGVTKGTIMTNQSGDTTIALDAGGGSSYTEGPGINIDNNEISVDSDVVALKSDLPNMNNYYNTTQVDLMLQDKADISELPDVSKMVTTNTTQTITGAKEFTSGNGVLVRYIKSFNGNTLLGEDASSTASYLGNYTHAVELRGTDIIINRSGMASGQTYTNIDSGNIGTYALTSSNISTNAYIQALEARIATLEANINGGSAASA